MSVNLNLNPQANVGQVTLRWSFREFRELNRSVTWWVTAGGVALAMIIYAVIIANFLFALIIIMVAFIFVGETRRTPRTLECKITSTGVVVGKKYWRWSDFLNFWITYNPPAVTNLYLVPKNPFDPRITVPLEKTNPLKVREFLTKHITEDLEREDEPTSEAINRLLKLR